MNDIITDDFKEALITAVEVRTSAHVVMTQVLKNNGVRLTGLLLNHSGIGKGVSPTFYLESIWPVYRTEENIDSIADEIVRILSSASCGDADGAGITAEQVETVVETIISSPENLKSRIFPRLVNYDWNTELLTSLPHRRFLDPAVTYDVEVTAGNRSFTGAVLRLKNEMMENLKPLGLTESDLYKAAMRNARTRSYVVTPIGELINHSLADAGFYPAHPGQPVHPAADDIGELNDPEGMIVITNPSGINGAYGMLDDALLESVSKRFELSGEHGKCGDADFYILPSSVNEIIAVPGGAEAGIDEMRSLVKVVNETNLPREEWLSESVYIFERGKGLRIA